MLFKKKSIEIHLHEVLRRDWENVLDALFRNTIANSVKGIGIICNTSREHPGDGEGIVQEELIYHIKQKRADEVRTQLKKIDFDHFKKIFENYTEGNQKGLDFYRIKNILTNEIMVYPLLKAESRIHFSLFSSNCLNHVPKITSSNSSQNKLGFQQMNLTLFLQVL